MQGRLRLQVIDFIFKIFHILVKFELVFGQFWRFNKQTLLDGVNNTNTVYGGLDYDATNVFFTYGSLDPWHSLCIIDDDENKPYIVKGIPGT